MKWKTEVTHVDIDTGEELKINQLTNYQKIKKDERETKSKQFTVRIIKFYRRWPEFEF